MRRAFRKFDIRNPIYTGGGWKIPFEDWGNGSDGGIITEDSYLIGELRKCVDEQRGGVMEVTEAEYYDLKKKAPTQSQSKRWREVFDVRKIGQRLGKLYDAAVAAGKAPLPDVVRNFTPHEQMTKPSGISTFRPKAVVR